MKGYQINFKYLFFIAIGIRVITSFLPSFDIDMNAWLAWAERLDNLGFANFYSDTVWTQYTPGFLYILYGTAKLNIANELVIKIIILIADIATAYVLYFIIQHKNKLWGKLAFLIYLFNPALVFVGSVWGQIDGLLTLFLLLSVYFLIEKKNIIISLLFWAIAFLIKPQALALAPLYLLIFIKKPDFKKWLKGTAAALGIFVIASFPFFPKDPFTGLIKLVLNMGEHYHFGSIFAFNLWELLGKTWVPDETYFHWGIIIYLTSLIIIAIAWSFSKKDKASYYLVASMCQLAFFLFPTRIHERYLFPFFAFFLIYLALKKSRKLLYIYIISSVAFLINLYYPYAYYSDNYLKSELLLKLAGNLAPFIAIFFILIFIKCLFLLANTKLYFHNFINISLRNTLKFILLFALLSRIIFLWQPPTEYFDEVYHAFTAKEMLHWNSTAWHWKGGAPEGFAYEWTHPPMAKIGMIMGMIIFGENSFGWRLPGALLGTGSVYLVYLIAKKLFGKKTGVLSSLIFALDGLPLVMSRIGTNDTYFLFFILLSFYLFVIKKHFISALSLGFAIASKWSTFWFLPILVLAHFLLNRKITKNYIWYFMLPPIIYLASYTPMFFAGYKLETFWQMQKQMWWYHTNLVATHPYTSSWWSWPMLTRPIFLYVNEAGDKVSKIYAMGNPIIFWFGLISIFVAVYFVFKEKNRKLGLIVFSYFAFFVPWALSPRIMFLYHYLPSIPFMAIAIGFILNKFPKLIIPVLLISCITFIYFYPHWIGLAIPKWLDESYYWFDSWR